MTDTNPPAKPTGVKAKANDAVMKAYLKAPPKAQTVMLNGFLKVHPYLGKLKPHAKKIVGGGVGVLALKRIRKRGK